MSRIGKSTLNFPPHLASELIIAASLNGGEVLFLIIFN